MSRWTAILLSWLGIGPATALSSAFFTARIADRWLAGVDYYPSQHPTQTAAFGAFFLAIAASFIFTLWLPFRLEQSLEPKRQWQAVGWMVIGHACILFITMTLGLALTFSDGIPQHGQVPQP